MKRIIIFTALLLSLAGCCRKEDSRDRVLPEGPEDIVSPLGYSGFYNYGRIDEMFQITADGWLIFYDISADEITESRRIDNASIRPYPDPYRLLIDGNDYTAVIVAHSMDEFRNFSGMNENLKKRSSYMYDKYL